MIINEEFRTRERMNVVAGSARVEGQLACMAADFRDPHKFDAVDLSECAFHFTQRNRYPIHLLSLDRLCDARIVHLH